MTAPLHRESRPLKAFRLPDIPEAVRVAAAQSEVDSLTRALKPKIGGVGGHPLEAFAGIGEAAAIMKVALNPSSTVYRIPQDSWDAMVAKQKKRKR